ncbi:MULTISPECIES: hydroxylamine reductase [Anaerococcus]|uniref:Hydroxylamine reductase n=1 Tax=Anaerococcus octavius TaxID=54007 RepID=A0A380WW92_9FIRM|nr:MULTISPECIES: hydroxylamine reductase [Anaerococcus]MDU0894173.1 hydroxylamine reductase [Anaerococcus sp.]MDU3177144.1 hydroxylamine reductase [Anaerococcus sp.]MDU4025161.1 hydroxylamine reductase [Anaerococcus sp.]MDU7411848.1 hydroxylamine reductase [Anaerococcus sp.]SUU93073.1 Hydroxylamine reductase [Anaerococcus octavius]
MFCYQCQETAKNQGCTVQGVCGKKEDTANSQDLLIYVTKGLAEVANKIGEDNDKVYDRISNNLFITITNANFDTPAIMEVVKETIKMKDELLEKIDNKEDLSDFALYSSMDDDELSRKAIEVGVLNIMNEDERSLVELCTYGLKGMAAYNHHANVLGYKDHEVDRFIAQALEETTKKDKEVASLIDLVMATGEHGVKAMGLLDKANTESYGNPEITEVDYSAGNKPGILISGHDLHDMKMLLEQSKDSGVEIYTHSEMLPANYYPEFKKYDHFHGNYGSSWWHQNEEFESFNGPILMTTNCIVPMKKDNTYQDRMFTTGNAGYPGCKHIEVDENGNKDFSEIIELAKTCRAPENLEDLKVTGGFAHNQVIQLSDKIVEEIKAGNIKKFVVMGGCDGRFKERNYYSEFAEGLPEDYIILTAGCAKYRYNKLGLGDINGIPRVLDAGQCNDSYSLVQIALALKDAFGLDDINDLPIEYNIAWYEQKAVIVLLALLSLGVKNIHLGPTLPAFLSPTVVDFLVENFGIAPISTVEDDLTTMTA